MTSRHTGLRLLAAATALTAFAAPAAAQRVDRIVAFGDSYADTGNAVAILLASPFVSPATKTLLRTVYPTGRFSGGTNYIDTLSTILGAPVVDYAVGGATTGSTNGTVPGVGLTQEVGIFLSNTTPPGTIFPQAGGFQEGDLLALSIGGNDARAYYTANPSATTAQATAAAASSVAFATANTNALVAAGAPTISFLALDASGAPDLLSNPTAQALAKAYSQSFNTGFQSTLAGYAANGTIVHYLDGATVLSNVVANKAAFGISNLYCPALPNPTCIVNSSGYLFYADGVHLTSDGFAILARYVAAQLEAPLTFQATSDSALDTAHQWGRTLTTRMDLAAPRDGDQPEGAHFYVVGDSLSRSTKNSAHADAYRATTTGVTAGVDFGFGSGVVGVAANYSRPHVGLTNDSADVKSKTWQVGGYAGFGLAGGFAQGYVGYGRDRHRIVRQGVIDSLTADPKGHHVVAGAKAGYLMPMGQVRVGPVVALDYAKVKVDGYTENGDAALSLNVGRVNYHSMRGSAGLEARGDFAPGGMSVRPYLALTAEKNLSGDGRVFSFSQTDAPIIVNSWDASRARKKVYGRLSAGLSAAVVGNLSVDATLSGTAGKPNGNETSAHLGVKLGF